MTRAEAACMSEAAMLIAADRLRGRLREDWQRGAPGKLSDVYDLAVIYAEAVVRGIPVPAPMLPGQLELDHFEDEIRF